MNSLWGRRQFVAGVGALAVAGCSTDAGKAPVGQVQNTARLSILTWADYIDPPDGDYLGTLIAASQALGLSIDYQELYEDNFTSFGLIEEAVANRTGAYDIVIPTNWRAAEMIDRGMAEQLPIELIPNHKNLDPSFMTNEWDRGSRYQMPWQAGMTGLAYNASATGRELTTVLDLFSNEFKGRVGFIGEMREAVGLAMLANGDDPSRATVATARAGLDRIAEAVASGQVGAVTFEDFADKLADGQLVAAMGWSGDTALLQADRPDLDIRFAIPGEGAIQWFDTMVIPKGAQSPGAAGEFMNYVYDPINAAQITQWVGYLSPVLGVQDVLIDQGDQASLEIANNPLIFPDPDTRARLFTWGGLSVAEEAELDAEFAELMGL